MDYPQLEEGLKRWEEAYRPLADPEAAAAFGLCGEPPATAQEIAALEAALETPLPPGLRDFLLNYSRKLTFSAFLKDDFCASLPPPLRGVFSAGLDVSLAGIAAAEAARRDWLKKCLSDPDDAYGRAFHGKLGLLCVGNGDVIACAAHDGKEEHRVVYLSHDGGEGHGRALGGGFADFLERYAAVGLCGPEDWQMLPFLGGATGIDPDCPNAVLYRRLVFRRGLRAARTVVLSPRRDFHPAGRRRPESPQGNLSFAPGILRFPTGKPPLLRRPLPAPSTRRAAARAPCRPCRPDRD